MYGFIYFWYDRKHKRYYLGKHFGTIDDGYICSSPWMNKAYKRRPQDFRRRILEIVDDRKLLADREEAWGSSMKPSEIGKRYYNLRPPGGKQWHDTEEGRRTVGQKISAANSGRTLTLEWKEKVSKSLKGCIVTENKKKQIAETLRGKSHTEERRKNMSEAGKNRKRASCIHCRKEMNVSLLSRYHNGKCIR